MHQISKLWDQYHLGINYAQYGDESGQNTILVHFFIEFYHGQTICQFITLKLMAPVPKPLIV